MSSLSGRRLGSYEITTSLGAGGMGEVWRATDTRLGREVALKMLPADMASDPDRLERFDREARAVASLNHPHIVTIHSIEEAEGLRFLTMELIEGQSLDTLIPDGGLDLQRFFELATPLSEAISAAHDKSVIHRDLKPSNVMVDADGRVKVLDFGLAKLHGPEGVSESSALATEALTGVGTIVGTVPYMSPEQIEGKIVDHRTDIFSLGVLMYEMATGERPFSGESSPGLMSSILKDTPTSVLEIRTDLPRHLGRIIGRCLEKDRRDRYQTARDVFNELRALQRESGSTGAWVTPEGRGPRDDRPSELPSSGAMATASTRRDEGFWVALLPFKYTGADHDITSLAEGLTEDIITGLSRFSYLRVVARSSTLRYANQAADVRTVGHELGARYVMEGSLRTAGRRLRVAAQLVDTHTGAHLWADSYDRVYDPDDLFELQDDIVPRIVSTCADHFGVLARAISEAVRGRPLDELTPYEALMRGFGYHFRLDPVEHAQAREALERAVDLAPSNADCWAMLSWVYSHEHAHDFNPRPGSLDRAIETARRAVDLAPSNHLAQQVLAVALFFRGETAACRSACERALALNALDASNEAIFILAFLGDWERGCALIRRAMELNPHHPSWYRVVFAIDHYRRRDYRAAVDEAVRSGASDLFWTNWLLAAAYGQLGDLEAARASIDLLLTQKPDFPTTGRALIAKWFEPELAVHLLDGLAKAGLHLVGAGPPAGRTTPSSLAHAGEAAVAATQADAVAIAVLPFSDMSPDKDQDYLCEGMAEEIMNALVHVDGIHVASRTSTFRAVDEGQDLRAIGRSLSVGQVLEGSVRLAGDTLRVTAQLIDVDTGYQLWSQRFDRDATDVFAVQDEIAAGVVEAVTSRLTPGERRVRERSQVGDLEAYRHYLKGRHYRYSKNDHASALASFERALALDPTHGPSWVGKAEVTVLAAVYSLIPSREAYATATEALHTARRLQRESAEGSYVEGMIAVCERKWLEAETALLRAVELEPTFVQGLCWTGFLYSVLRRWDEAGEFFSRACELDPLAPYPYAMMACGLLANARSGEALDAAEQAIGFDGENTLALWTLGMARVAVGRLDEGVAALEKAATHSRRGGYILGVLGWGLATSGRSDEARTVLDELEARDRTEPTVVPEAWIRAVLGDLDGAWQVLESALEERQAILTLAGFPAFDPLRCDPRFEVLLERLGLPPAPSAGRPDTAPDNGPLPEKSIAVLPFVNLSPDADNEYFSDGLTDEIITDLSRIQALRVISRSSAMRLKGDQRGLAAISRDLGCRYVLEGSVRRAADNLRITARLVDAPNDKQLWADKHSGTLDDVFDIQERVSRSIVDALEIQLTPREAEQLAERPIPDVRAQECYLRARRETWSFLPGGLDKAISHLEAGLALVGDNALLYQGLGEAYFQAINIGAAGGREDEYITKAERCAEKIFAIEPDSPRGFSVRAHLQLARGDIHGCRRSWQRVLRVFPNDVQALQLSAHILGWLGGKPDAAAPLVAQLLDIDPLDPMSRLMSVTVPLFAGRFSEALEPGRRMFALDPVTPIWRANYAMALAYNREFDEAEALTEGLEAQPDSDVGTWWMGLWRAAWREDRAEVERLADGPYQRAAAWDAEIPWVLASAHAAVGAREEALLWLDRAIDQGMINYPFLSEHDYFLESIRGDHRFGLAMDRARREWERFDG